jgi:hypothetical protein
MEGKLSVRDRDPGKFVPFHMAHSDDFLFFTDALSRLRAYAFAADGGMPELVRELKELKEPRGMAFHRATGTLLIACADLQGRQKDAGVELLDTRPPLSEWCLNTSKKDARLLPPILLAIDEPNRFVYVATHEPQTITQYKATVKTADEKTAAVAGGSTVDLKLTAVRLLEGVQYPLRGRWGELTAIAVLSPSTLLLSHTIGLC